jgi:hypothetical protein
VAEPKCSDDEFIAIFRAHGARGAAKLLEMGERSVYDRRVRIEKRLGIEIPAPGTTNTRLASGYQKHYDLEVRDGVVLVGSDAHVWPGKPTPAQRGFCLLAREFRDRLVAAILNGDILDGARISRHDRIGWAEVPTLREELEAVDEFTTEVQEAAGERAQLLWTIGNHDLRFETYLAKNAKDVEGLSGSRLAERFLAWRMMWIIRINQDIVCKHRFKGGIHATHNNALWSGKTMVTGHLHSLKVTPFDDYNGTRWGVDTGTLSDPTGEHADYAEGNPLNHRSGFVVLTFKDGKLLWPEIAAVVDENHIQFRGEILNV